MRREKYAIYDRKGVKASIVRKNSRRTNTKVIGVGGAGCNAINRMAEVGIKGVTLISVNTDAQVLEVSKADIVVQIGENLQKVSVLEEMTKVGEEAA